MTQIDKPEIEELLSSYIDGELSERQCNEVKRLLDHDPQVAEMLARMERQKELLNALPVESAPETMLADIKGSLERNLLIGREVQEIREVAPSKGIFARRVLAAAAMILVPIGILSIVVLSLFSSPPEGKDNIAKNDSPGVTVTIADSGIPDSDIAVELLPGNFNSALQLATSEAAAVNSFIEKAIYSNGLSDNTVLSEKDTINTYRVSSTPTLITALLQDMETIWAKCRTNRFMVYDEQLQRAAVVNNITSVQILDVFEQAEPEGRITVAKMFAEINPAVGSVEATVRFDPSNPIKPVLTGPEQVPTTDDASGVEEKITLIITVAGL